MQATHQLEVRMEVVRHTVWEDGPPVLVTLSPAHQDDALGKADVLHATQETLVHAEAGAVEKPRRQLRHAIHHRKHGGYLAAGHHFGEATSTLGAHGVLPDGHRNAEHFAVEEEQRGERLVLRGRAHLPLHREHGEERRDFAVASLARMRRRDVPKVPLHPAQVGLLGARAQVPQARAP